MRVKAVDLQRRVVSPAAREGWQEEKSCTTKRPPHSPANVPGTYRYLFIPLTSTSSGKGPANDAAAAAGNLPGASLLPSPDPLGPPSFFSSAGILSAIANALLLLLPCTACCCCCCPPFQIALVFNVLQTSPNLLTSSSHASLASPHTYWVRAYLGVKLASGPRSSLNCFRISRSSGRAESSPRRKRCIREKKRREAEWLIRGGVRGNGWPR